MYRERERERERDADGIIVIKKMNLESQVTILDGVVCISFLANTLGKDM